MRIKRRMFRIWKKQLKNYYSGNEKHEICLTCMTIASNNLKKIILDDLEKAAKFYHPNPSFLLKLIEKWKKN
ncbi:hypothetical protein LCGC14_0546530 [marine sediment metagenome]|uniref:Uncharacterized protein n=1 Tax=marine sediment metagenome TaxID=412755 RepID=A0A0F9UZD5_9ZZZZ